MSQFISFHSIPDFFYTKLNDALAWIYEWTFSHKFDSFASVPPHIRVFGVFVARFPIDNPFRTWCTCESPAVFCIVDFRCSSPSALVLENREKTECSSVRGERVWFDIYTRKKKKKKNERRSWHELWALSIDIYMPDSLFHMWILKSQNLNENRSECRLWHRAQHKNEENDIMPLILNVTRENIIPIYLREFVWHKSK